MSYLRDNSFDNNRTTLFPSNTSKFKNSPSLYSELLVRAFALFDTFSEKKPEDSIAKIFNTSIQTKPFSAFLDKYACRSESFSPEELQDRKQILKKTLDLLGKMPLSDRQSLFRHSK